MPESCWDEVRLLDPRNDARPVIKEFTALWISRVSKSSGVIQHIDCDQQAGVKWPATADVRLKTFMHEHNVYNPEDPDIKMLALIQSLSKGTEIETRDVQQYNAFKRRVEERISFLARSLSEKGLIETKDGTTQKHQMFKEIWKNRHTQWGPNSNASRSASKSKAVESYEDVYDMDSLPPDKSPSLKRSNGKRPPKNDLSSPSKKVSSSN